MIRRQSAQHRVGARLFKPGHFDIIFSDGRVEHFHSEAAAKEREKQVERFKHMDDEHE